MKKILISILLYVLLFLPYYNFSNADHTLLHSLKQKKAKSKNDIQGSTSAKDSTKTPTLEKCKKKIATLAVVEPQDYEMLALSQYSLPSPTSLIRLIVQQSNCFIVLERGIAMQNLLQERTLSSSGELKQDQNMGKGQMITADYILTPTIIFKDESPCLILGAPGGTYITMGNLQVILNVLDFGMSAQEAVSAPRFAATSNVIELSNRIFRSTEERLKLQNYSVVRNPESYTFAILF